jgi:hypothetical protein
MLKPLNLLICLEYNEIIYYYNTTFDENLLESKENILF